jgi:hypothetical protein
VCLHGLEKLLWVARFGGGAVLVHVLFEN